MARKSWWVNWVPTLVPIVTVDQLPADGVTLLTAHCFLVQVPFLLQSKLEEEGADYSKVCSLLSVCNNGLGIHRNYDLKAA